MSTEDDFPPFACVTIVGLGLMGGSLALALRERRLARRIVGVDTRSETLQQARALNAIDAGTTDLAAGVAEADGVVLAAPVGILPVLLERLTAHVRSEALVTDLGSTKARIVGTGDHCFGARFVGGHPMAGSAESGFRAARPDLFTGAPWAIVRAEPFCLENDPHASRLAALTVALGARPLPMTATHHDHLAALVSHLPHVLSFAFARTVAADSSAEQAPTFSGGSYRDLMRVSAANPALWQDIFRENRTALLAALSAFEAQLHDLKLSIETSE